MDDLSKKTIVRTLILLGTLILTLGVSDINGKGTSKGKSDYIKYKLKLGWFTLGSGNVTIAKNDTVIQNSTMHKVKVHTETLGLGNWLSNLDDDYVTYIDSKKLRTHSSYKDVTADDSHWEQWNRFLYEDSIIDIRALDHRKEQPKRSWQVRLEENVYDILGTFIYFKEGVDWSQVKKHDTVMIKSLYKHKLYRVGLKSLGLEKIKYEGNYIWARKLRLVMPDQEKLKDDRPVYIWVSNDSSQYPIRIYSKLFIGSARCELESINGKEPRFK